MMRLVRVVAVAAFAALVAAGCGGGSPQASGGSPSPSSAGGQSSAPGSTGGPSSAPSSAGGNGRTSDVGICSLISKQTWKSVTGKALQTHSTGGRVCTYGSSGGTGNLPGMPSLLVTRVPVPPGAGSAEQALKAAGQGRQVDVGHGVTAYLVKHGSSSVIQLGKGQVFLSVAPIGKIPRDGLVTLAKEIAAHL